jgi:hypothetical protein
MTEFDLKALIKLHTDAVKAELGHWNRVEAAKRIAAAIPGKQLRAVLAMTLPAYLGATDSPDRPAPSDIARAAGHSNGRHPLPPLNLADVPEYDPTKQARQFAQSRRMASIPAYERMLQKKVSPNAKAGSPRQDELGDCGVVECRLLSVYHGKLEGTHGRLKRAYAELGDRLEAAGVALVRDLPVSALEEFAPILLDGEEVAA